MIAAGWGSAPLGGRVHPSPCSTASAASSPARGKAFKITAAGGSTAPNSTDTMPLDQIERWIGDHIKPKR